MMNRGGSGITEARGRDESNPSLGSQIHQKRESMSPDLRLIVGKNLAENGKKGGENSAGSSENCHRDARKNAVNEAESARNSAGTARNQVVLMGLKILGFEQRFFRGLVCLTLLKTGLTAF
jgi:hypothetical protein